MSLELLSFVYKPCKQINGYFRQNNIWISIYIYINFPYIIPSSHYLPRHKLIFYFPPLNIFPMTSSCVYIISLYLSIISNIHNTKIKWYPWILLKSLLQSGVDQWRKFRLIYFPFHFPQPVFMFFFSMFCRIPKILPKLFRLFLVFSSHFVLMLSLDSLTFSNSLFWQHYLLRFPSH